MSWPWVALVVSVLLTNSCAGLAAERPDEPVAEPTRPITTGTTPSPSATSTAAKTPVASQRDGTRVIVDDSQFGPMLYAADGQAIYLFDLEATPHARCYDECAAAWPPVLTDGQPVAGHGVRPELVGTADREDGTTQVLYAGHPLYFYAHEDPWQVLCHDFEDFGGTWYVVRPGGTPAP